MRSLATKPVPIDAFISNLSDHDYVSSIHAFEDMSARLTSLMTGSNGSFANEPHGLRNAVFSQTSAIRLYQLYATSGPAAFAADVRRAVQFYGFEK